MQGVMERQVKGPKADKIFCMICKLKELKVYIRIIGRFLLTSDRIFSGSQRMWPLVLVFLYFGNGNLYFAKCIKFTLIELLVVLLFVDMDLRWTDHLETKMKPVS